MNKPDIIFSSNVYVTAMLIFMPNATKASSCNASATIHTFSLLQPYQGTVAPLEAHLPRRAGETM